MMSVDASESLEDLLSSSRYRAVAVVTGKSFRWIKFYTLRRFNGYLEKNTIAFLRSADSAKAFAMVVERRGGETLLLAIEKGIKTLIGKCNSEGLVYTDLIVRAFKRGGLAIPKTIWIGMPIVMFPESSWEKFRDYELSTIKRYCKELCIVDTKPIRLKDLSYIINLPGVYKSDKRFLNAIRKAGILIDYLESAAKEIQNQLAF